VPEKYQNANMHGVIDQGGFNKDQLKERVAEYKPILLGDNLPAVISTFKVRHEQMMIESDKILINMMQAYFDDNVEKFTQYGLDAAEPSVKLAADFVYTIFNLSEKSNALNENKSQNGDRFSKTSHNRIDFLKEELNKPVSSYVMVAAHRGNWRDAPENSLQAIKSAIELAVDIVEVDVKKTKDGKLFLMHDETLDRTTTGKGKGEDYSWEDLEKLSLKDMYGNVTQYKIPTFEETMLLIKDEHRVFVNVHVRGEYLKEVGDVFKRTGTANFAIVKTNLQPEIIKETIHNIEGAYHMPVLHMESSMYPLKIMDSYINAFKPKIMEVSFKKDTSSFFENPAILTKRGVKIWNTTTSSQWCAGHDDKVAVELNNPEDSWGWLINKGATIILTDRPRELIQYLKIKGFRNQAND
jgi:glycerophosphoryl diester phosphodiesterase